MLVEEAPLPGTPLELLGRSRCFGFLPAEPRHEIELYGDVIGQLSLGGASDCESGFGVYDLDCRADRSRVKGAGRDVGRFVRGTRPVPRTGQEERRVLLGQGDRLVV